MVKKAVLTFICIGTIVWNVSSQNLSKVQTNGTRFVNSSGPINLRGLNISNNVWGFWQWPLSDSLQSVGKDPLIKPRFMQNFVFTQADVQNIKSIGSNVARYQIDYELFAESNTLRNANIDTLRSHISKLENIGVYTVICLSMQPGLNVQNDNYERDKSPSVRLKSVFESDSIFQLWRNMWQFVAGKVYDMPAVAGYELLNEPRKPATADASNADLLHKYLEVIDSIRSKDADHIIFVPDFYSKEANPGEQYWNNTTQQFVTDAGEQGIIWQKEWIAIPDSISNLAYITHIYDPSDFTLFGASSFNPSVFGNAITDAVTWVYSKNHPLFISEYGVSYEHTFNHEPEKQMSWVTQVHALFEQNNVSSTYFQYKTLLTPFVNLKTELGLWFHYYDPSTITSNGNITYDQSSTQTAAVNNGVDSALKEYFIQNNQLQKFSVLENGNLIQELRRYFGNAVLSVAETKEAKTQDLVYLFSASELIIATNLLQAGILSVNIYGADGRRVLQKKEVFYDGKGTVNISSLQRSQFFIVEYGNEKESRRTKIVMP